MFLVTKTAVVFGHDLERYCNDAEETGWAVRSIQLFEHIQYVVILERPES